MLYECINLTHVPSNRFQPLIDRGFVYVYQEVYLGGEGEITSPDGNVVIAWTYTQRDGVFVHIKRKHPWRIIFDYCDGNCMCNNDQKIFESLIEALERSLNNLQKKIVKDNHLDILDIYDKLECLIKEFLEQALKLSNSW